MGKRSAPTLKNDHGRIYLNCIQSAFLYYVKIGNQTTFSEVLHPLVALERCSGPSSRRQYKITWAGDPKLFFLSVRHLTAYSANISSMLSYAVYALCNIRGLYAVKHYISQNCRTTSSPMYHFFSHASWVKQGVTGSSVSSMQGIVSTVWQIQVCVAAVQE